MPKTYLTRESQIKARLTAWVYAQLKLHDMTQCDLADEMGITQSALNRKLRLDTYSFEDFCHFVKIFKADTCDMLWLAGKGE